ncbi:ROK family transcriptional regulator [Thorsellia anophelis]|uniref:Sugar kinase of the NBD/HSP70 family, may contain an N-terminal HTH domain n=1 Tax=Thorsellia anophelis DSM 18579 TaxID=1123402 RepID=A0A1I0C9M7_9GAMM|nr:ROK family transcriptional regulator [Thorsellia anophelis]SET16169.1 Sugar kinase of the NBD/HSP70 family, may contain an N-terminal HTH domain [Thorsellia anophelis DSM 18579]
MNQLNLTLRPHHRFLLDVIRLHAPVTRAELSRITRLTPGAITQQCRELIFSGLVIEGDRITGNRGQPSLPLSLNPEGAYTLGVAFGADHIDFSAVDLAGNLLFNAQEFHEDNQTLTSALTQLKSFIPNTLDQYGLDQNRILGIGLALPGYIQKDGTCRPSVSWLHDWCNTDLTDYFSKAFSYPVWVENNANTSAIGEYYSGNWEQSRNLIALDFSYGLSAGIIIEGKLLRGTFGNAGEVGLQTQFPISEASQIDLQQAVEKHGLDYQDIDKLIESNHPVIDSWFNQRIDQIEQIVTSGMCWLDPELIVLTGILPKGLLARIETHLNRQLAMRFDSFNARAKIEYTRNGIENVALGAALLPLYQTLSLD